MRRRDVLGGIAGAAAGLTSPAVAQLRRPAPAVAFVLGSAPVRGMLGDDPAIPFVRAFVHGLREAGWVDGQTVRIERRSAEGVRERAPAIFAELLASGVDAIAVGSEAWLQDAAIAATKTIPIVANLLDDPVAAGLTDNLAKPSGNLTGVTEATGPDFDGKRLQLLAEFAPHVGRVAYLASRRKWELSRHVPRPPGLVLVPATLEVADGIEDAFAAVRRERADALMVVGEGPTFFQTGAIVKFASVNRLPAIYGYRDAVALGGAIAYGANGAARFRQMAGLVDRFLRGARLGDVPTVRPTAFELVVNANTARELGLSIPASLLARADEVID